MKQLLGYEFEPRVFSYGDHEVILYALGVGAGQDPLDPHDLPFVYEREPNGLQVLPTFASLFPLFSLGSIPAFAGALALHGEEHMVLRKELPPRGRILCKGRISQVLDKGTGALVVIEATSWDEQGDEVAVNRTSAFLPGLGGFGGESGPPGRSYTVPARAPDRVHRERIAPNQALLYRLLGDTNPIHVDPTLAHNSGYSRPILHGLCTYGFAARAILRQFCSNNPARFQGFKVRFSKHVFPGETLITEMWRESQAQVLFRCKVAERDGYVLTNGVAELDDDVP